MRKSGILMHITSLPSPYGIGTLGKDAFDFLKFLKKSGQASWQMLPLTPTGYGDSPYQSCSAYAGNPYLIDLDLLIADGLLLPEEPEGICWGDDPTRVDFGRIYNNRTPVLKKAFARFSDDAALDAFCGENQDWLPDFALFMALKEDHQGKPWFQWEQALKFREPSEYQPHTYTRNTVCYTGTHDNMTTKQWFDSAPAEAAALARDYMALTKKEGFVWGTIRTALSSVSDLAVVQMQDYLELGGEARMNFPGTTGANWVWRATPGYLSGRLAGKIAKLSALYGRTPPAPRKGKTRK